MWKKYGREVSCDPDFANVKDSNAELNTPRVGGIIVWFSIFLTTILFFLLPLIFPGTFTEKINFLSRNQTLIPFCTLLFGALLGLMDDLVQIYGHNKFARDDVSWRFWKAGLIAFAALLIGMWFYYKLGMTSVNIPFDGDLYLGILIIPFFIIVALATFSGGVIDGLDGLSGGVFATIFASYSVIAYANNQIDIAVFCGVTTGCILAFLWFNIPPARFYMGETGIMALTLTLATVSFLTDTALLLPVIALPLVIESGSDIIQMTSKKLRHGKRVFRLAPIHHHFQAIGWPAYKVTMRFWVLSVMFSIIGIILFIVSR